MEKHKKMESILEENPFSFDYDVNKINKLLSENNLSQIEVDTIYFFNICNDFYLFSYSKIIEIYSLFTSKEEILDCIFKYMNRIYIDSNISILKDSLMSNSDSIALNLEKVQFTKYNNPNGLTINAKEVLQRGGDVLNVLINFLGLFETNNLSKEKSKDDKAKEELFYQLWSLASEVYGFNSYYEIIKYERGIIEFSEKNIKINLIEDSKNIRTLTTVSEIRNRNHIQEYTFYLNSFEKNSLNSKRITHYKIKNGHLSDLRVNYVKYTEIDKFDIAQYLKIEKYKENLDLSFYDGISLKKIFDIIITIQRFINLISTDNKAEIAYKINRVSLLGALFDVTGIEINTISKVLNAITEKADNPYFWRKPLLEYDESIYLSYSLFNAPNLDLLIGSIIKEAEISILDQTYHFKNQIINELLEVSEKYMFNLINLSDDLFFNNLVYELQDFYLIIEIKILEPFPIESIEINRSLESLYEASIKFKDKLTKLSLKTNKFFATLILTNYNFISGSVINDIFIFDRILLKNYLITGSFQKGQVILSKNSSISKKYNDFPYYNNEQEFNENFLSFLLNPIPITEIYSKLFWKKIAVFPEGSTYQIYIDVCDYIDNFVDIENKIEALNLSLNHQYFNQLNLDRKEKEKELYQIGAQFYLTEIFHLIAFGNYEFSFYRFKISEVFKKINIQGFAHLIFYFRNSLIKLNSIKVKQDRTFNTIKYDEQEMLTLFSKFFHETSVSFRLLDFKISESLTKNEEKQLISFALEAISSVSIQEYKEQDFNNYLCFLSILKFFNRKYSLDYEFYNACINIISVLNFNNNYQTARNLAEEILLISIEEKKIHKGWEILFVCSDQQKNIFDASVYGCLYLTSLSTAIKLPYNEVIGIFFNILKFSRNIYSSEILDSVFNFLKSYKLKDYDDQKINLSYYLSILLKPYSEENQVKLKESLNYFNNNYKKIVRYNEKGVIPWLNYFYNIKRLQNDSIVFNGISVDEQIGLLEKTIPQHHFSAIKQKHFSGKELKKNFVNSIRKTLNTYSFSDYIFETQNLDIDVVYLIRDAVIKNDVESILLSGFVNNDIRLIYNNKYVESGTVVHFKTEATDYEYLNNYLDYILDRLILRKNQMILYLFTHMERVFGLTIDFSKNTKIIAFDNWTLKDMDDWFKNTNDFYFDSKKYYDLSEQEASYDSLINTLNFTNLNLDFEVNEILISTNTDLSKYPINLIVNNQDFIGSQLRVSNIILLDWFISNNEEILLSQNYTSTSWAPIEEGDNDINYGYSKLEYVLDENKVNKITDSFPSEINSDLNIFFAHGELNVMRFKAIYKSQEEDSAIISNKKLFGSGSVAILFICHSGKINKDFFSNSVVSLVHEIIELGYDAVIAPCWSLEVTIPEFWLSEFFTQFNSGVYISEAVFEANKKLSEYNDSISNAYYVAEGRLAMHLYGNPNIKVKK